MPTWAKQRPDRADYSCEKCLGAQVSSYLNIYVILTQAVTRLRSWVIGLSPRSPGFKLRAAHFGFVVEKVAQGSKDARTLPLQTFANVLFSSLFVLSLILYFDFPPFSSVFVVFLGLLHASSRFSLSSVCWSSLIGYGSFVPIPRFFCVANFAVNSVAFLLRVRYLRVQITAWSPTVIFRLPWIFSVRPLSQIRPRPLPYESSPTLYSLTCLPHDGVLLELLTASLNKAQINISFCMQTATSPWSLLPCYSAPCWS